MMNRRQGNQRRRIPGLVTGLGLAILLAAWTCTPQILAQDQTQSPQAEPARAIRLSFVAGKVSLSKNGQTLATDATANTPLFEGTEIKTAEDGRAEIQFEEGSVARLAPNTAVTLSTLSGAGPSGDAEITVQSGLAYFEFQETNESGTMRIHFGDAQVTASGFTVLRVNMDTPPGSLAVLSGNARVERGDAVANLHGGESITLDASSKTGYEISESIELDTWDSWNSDRDQALTSEASQGTEAGNKMSGGNTNPAWNDLDANGNWYNVPGQGYVWSPYDASNPYFDPYANGDWMWTPSYGYIFVSGYPWGYLPYQCGLWNFYGGFGWGWAPGLGGCSPWWGVGYYPGPFLGVVPVGYRPIRRPPIPVKGPPGRRIIPEKRPSVAYAHNLPSRSQSTAVQIAGNTVRPLPMIATRPQYNRSTGGISPQGPKYLTAPQPSLTPARPEVTPRSAPTFSAPRSAPPAIAPRPTSPGTAPRSAPRELAPRPSTAAPRSGGSSSSSHSGGGASASHGTGGSHSK